MNDPFIEVKDISLYYPVFNLSVKSLTKNFFKLKSTGTIETANGHCHVRALNNISFKLTQGDRVGLIGGNGSGKTTLLRLLSGIYSPTEGQINYFGKRGCILGTGFGMEEEATGYENITLCGVALGLSIREIQKKIHDIEEFTELGHYLQMPIRTYSAGMRARLAFGITTSITLDILMLDEGIGAGDGNFVNKAQKRLEKFMNNASILVLASHSVDLIRTFCNKILYLNSGHVEFFGDLDEGIQKYKKSYLS